MTTPRPIEHIGFLVPDLEAAIDRWSAATGYTFSPIARYRTDAYADHSDQTPHHHDARISFSREGSPRVELMEVTGSGTHGPAEVGVHHIGFQGVEDPAADAERLATLGIPVDGVSYDPSGRVRLCFTDRNALDGIRLELIAPLPSPIVRDDGSPLPVLPDTGRVDLWG